MRLYGPGSAEKSLSVMAQHPGPQACALKGLFTGMMASLGRKRFSGAGTLSLDEVYCPVQLIYDREIVTYVCRTANTLAGALSEDLLLVDDILSEPEGGFLTADSTLRHFRELQWDSAVFPTRTLDQWVGAGSPLESEAAREEVMRLLGEYEYRLPEDLSRALDRVFERATADLIG
jgi:trimethylamine:corrinoid methyltransferase-like protein